MGKSLQISILFLFLVSGASGQYMTSPDMKRIFPSGRTFKLSSWHGAVGANYNLPTTGNQDVNILDQGDTTYTVSLDPKGKFGYYAEFGRYHFTNDLMFFKYLDYSIGWRRIGGSESYTGTYTIQGDTSNYSRSTKGEGSFMEDYITVNFNLNNIIQVGDYTFVQNSLGMNGEYQVSSNGTNYEPRDPYGMTARTPDKFFLQFHYKLGIGYKLTPQLYIIPAFETPILSLLPFQNGRSTLDFLSSRYRPITFSIRLLVLSRYRKSAY